MRSTTANGGSSRAGGGFSAETIAELVRALHARAAEHPESPGLIASWPGVPASRMPAACAELRRQGHPVREIAVGQPKARRAWVMAARDDDTDLPDASAPLSQEPTVLVRALAVPATIAVARRTVAAVAQREGASETVCSAVAAAVTEACANVVVHAYADRDAPGELEVRAFKGDDALIVEVADEGRGLLPRLDAPGLGLGVLLMAQLADVLEIRTGGGHRGVAVRMRFNLEATEAIP